MERPTPPGLEKPHATGRVLGALVGRAWLDGAFNDLTINQAKLNINGEGDGGIKVARHLLFEGTIQNMQDVSAFPFDASDVELSFYTLGAWKTYDLSLGGESGPGKVQKYRLEYKGDDYRVKITPALRYEDSIPNWRLKACAYTITGGNGTFKVRLLVERKVTFYVAKVIFPLWVLGAIGLTTFMYEVDDFGSRMSNVSGMILSIFALLYVVSESLPKTNFLTTIDHMVLADLCLLLGCGVESVIVLSMDRGPAMTFNWVCGGVLSLLFIVMSGFSAWYSYKQASTCTEKWRAYHQKSGLWRGPHEIESIKLNHGDFADP